MLDDLIKEIESISELQYEMPIMTDSEGYLDKECPKEECLKKFKIYSEDYVTIGENEKLYCPFCGNNDNREKWYTTEQIEQAKEQAEQYVLYKFNCAMKKGIQKANRKINKNKSFIKIKLDYKESGKSEFINLPAEALEEMHQKIVCPECGCRYEVIGISYFCPMCGVNSLSQTFNKSLDKIKTNIKNIPAILKSNLNKDEAFMICETIRETSINNIVTAFQVYCESEYKLLNTEKKYQRNIFQSLGKGSYLFNEVLNKSYSDLITEDELNSLIICFQKRHCLEHNNGIVDNDYLKKTNDNKYKLGERIIVDDNEVINYVDIINKLCIGIKTSVEQYLNSDN